MDRCRLHITGASGTGTTTLGRAIATEWSVPHADSDDYYWEPTVPPYTVKRPVDDRLELMERIFVPRDAWVLTGSLVSWGTLLVEKFDAVVFLVLEQSTRLERLAKRERRRYGRSIEPEGVRSEAFEHFMAWAAAYDDPGFDGRSRHAHENWIRSLPCPVLRLNSAAPVPDLVKAVHSWDPYVVEGTDDTT